MQVGKDPAILQIFAQSKRLYYLTELTAVQMFGTLDISQYGKFLSYYNYIHHTHIWILDLR